MQITENYNYCVETLDLKKEIEGNFVDLGEHLNNIREHNLFEPQWSSFLEFCDELRMSQNMVNKLIQIYKTFVLGYSFTKEEIATAGGWGNLQEILPMITSKKTAVYWLDKASILSREDLRKEVKEEKTGVPMATCKHKDFYLLKVCRDCGDKIYEI